VFEAIPDKLAPDEILRQAESAAKAAADKLVSQAPNSKVCILNSYFVNCQQLFEFVTKLHAGTRKVKTCLLSFCVWTLSVQHPELRQVEQSPTSAVLRDLLGPDSRTVLRQS